MPHFKIAVGYEMNETQFPL